MKFNSITEIKKANKAAGGHFFDEGAIKFFNSKIYTTIYGDNVFITSEQFDPYNYPEIARKWSVRYIDENGRICSPNDHATFTLMKEAIKFANNYVNGLDIVRSLD